MQEVLQEGHEGDKERGSEMTLRDFVNYVKSYPDSILDKEILIECRNGLLVEPKLKFIRRDFFDPRSGILQIVITP